MTESGVRALTPGDAGELAGLHAQAFAAPWDAAAIDDLLRQAGVFGLGVRGPDVETTAFILCRVVADEAEILTLATAPAVRGQGLGRRLVEAAAETAALRGATRLFLEVADDNAAALALYARTGFIEVGRRRAYYARPGAAAVDARVLALEFDQDFTRDFRGRLPSG